MIIINNIANLTFKTNKYYITQNYSTTHNGIDYGTYNKKINIYPIEDGKVTYSGKDSYGGNLVKIYYPRINKTFYYGHLDKIYVKKSQKVNNNTVIGITGKTGLATGIHLHLSIYDNKTKKFIDPNTFIYEENIYIVKKGDTLTKIAKKYHTTYKELYNKNKSIIKDPNLIYPGQKLHI